MVVSSRFRRGCRSEKYTLRAGDEIGLTNDQLQYSKTPTMSNRIYTTGSLLLTAALIACGLSFFAPFWLQNVKAFESDLTNDTYLLDGMYEGAGNYSRGLWAQCRLRCQWFWEKDFLLQKTIFTPLKWHLATQVLYTVGAVLVLVAELFSRLQLCCTQRRSVYTALCAILLISFATQVSALITFGVSSWNKYGALSHPLENYAWEDTDDIYFHWAYWMTIPAALLTLLSFAAFSALGCCCRNRWED